MTVRNRQRRPDRTFLHVGIFLMLMAITFVVAGLWVRTLLIASPGDTVVEGQVVDVEIREKRDPQTDQVSLAYAPVVEYVDPATGQFYTVQSIISGSSQPDIGEVRTVAFPSGDPTDGRVLGQVWFAWIFIVVGVVISLLAGLLLSVGLRQRRANATVEVGPSPTTEDPQDIVRPDDIETGPSHDNIADDSPQDG